MTTATHIGRPTKCTPELIDKVVGLIGAGNYIETACEACGIAKNQYYRWLERAEPFADLSFKDVPEAEKTFVTFRHAIKKAYFEAETNLLSELRTKQNWQPLAWILERTRNQRYGQKQQIEVTDRRTISVVEIQPVSRGEITDGEVREITDGTDRPG